MASRSGPLNRRALVLVLCVLAPLAAFAGPAGADPQTRLEQLEEKRAAIRAQLERVERREGEVAADFRVVDERRAEAEARLAAADSTLEELTARMARLTRRMTRAQQELALVTEDLARVYDDLSSHTDLFTARAVAAYKSGPTAYLDGMMSAESFGELVDRYAYAEAALQSDAEIVERIEQLRNEVEQQEAIAEAKQEEIARARLALERDRAAAARLREQRAAVYSVVRRSADEKAALLGSVRQNRVRLEAIQRQLEQESSEIASILAARSAGVPAGTPHGTGQMLWPANGSVTSPYGYRVHPIFGSTRLHTGIDIGAPYGAPVFAADSGTVIYVGAMSGYGNVVIVDHGAGLATTYNHLSAFAVSDGQVVGRGATIAAVGCTGYCTGPHLHFEVRANGAPVDPMPYLQ